MIYFITGASGSGKTAIIPRLKELCPNLVVHDFDDIGVPENPDKSWRQESTEKWINRYLTDNQDKSVSYCICGQMVLGEILACPSANQLKQVNILLLDVSDVERIKRLKARNTYGANQDMLNWSAWLRMHHHDPQWHQSVIKDDCWEHLEFSRWDKDVAWPNNIVNQKILDTTPLSIEEVALEVNSWINSNDT